MALAALDADPTLSEGVLATEAHAARADLLRLVGREEEAAEAYRAAIHSARDDRTARSLERLLAEAG